MASRQPAWLHKKVITVFRSAGREWRFDSLDESVEVILFGKHHIANIKRKDIWVFLKALKGRAKRRKASFTITQELEDIENDNHGAG